MRLSTRQSAVLFMLGAAILVAGTSIMAKTLGLSGDGFEGLHAFQVSAGRYFFGFCTLLTFTLLRPAMRPSFEGTAWPVHAIRALVGWMGVTAMFAAVAAMPIAEATAISFLNPLIAMILAVMFLGENLNAKKLIAAALSIAGAVMILRPGGESFQIAGLCIVRSYLYGCRNCDREAVDRQGTRFAHFADQQFDWCDHSVDRRQFCVVIAHGTAMGFVDSAGRNNGIGAIHVRAILEAR